MQLTNFAHFLSSIFQNCHLSLDDLGQLGLDRMNASLETVLYQKLEIQSVSSDTLTSTSAMDSNVTSMASPKAPISVPTA